MAERDAQIAADRLAGTAPLNFVRLNARSLSASRSASIAHRMPAEGYRSDEFVGLQSSKSVPLCPFTWTAESGFKARPLSSSPHSSALWSPQKARPMSSGARPGGHGGEAAGGQAAGRFSAVTIMAKTSAVGSPADGSSISHSHYNNGNSSILAGSGAGGGSNAGAGSSGTGGGGGCNGAAASRQSRNGTTAAPAAPAAAAAAAAAGTGGSGGSGGGGGNGGHGSSSLRPSSSGVVEHIGSPLRPASAAAAGGSTDRQPSRSPREEVAGRTISCSGMSPATSSPLGLRSSTAPYEAGEGGGSGGGGGGVFQGSGGLAAAEVIEAQMAAAAQRMQRVSLTARPATGGSPTLR